MTVTADRRRESLAPAFLAAAALHLAIFLIALYGPRPPLGPLGTAVPITLVAHGPTTDSRPAEAAPVTQAAQTETPVPEAKAPTPPAAPPPRPAPPQPKTPPVKAVKPAPEPKPTPTPKPVKAIKPAPEPKPTPTPAKAQPRPATPARPAPDTFSLDALAADVARSRHASPPRPASGARGPARPETAPEARVDAGQGVSQSDIAGLSQLLERLWNPNCNVAGGDSVVIPVKYTVSFDGHVIGRIAVGGHGGASDAIAATAARRAVDAIHQAEPYAETFRGQTFTVIFDAKKACANR
jgi:outer membrane biosynthesis protein TonB